MKILKMTTHWTTEEADCLYRLLDELQSAIWEQYGKDIEQLYEAHREEQWKLKQARESEVSSFDEMPF
ncbi:MAG: hypothetical protein ISR74_06515 [Candidatus Thioglobus sp.]|nr:hypothetical protein [Candidatus Thioglobus sp.]